MNTGNGEALGDNFHIVNTGKALKEDSFLCCVDSAAEQNGMHFSTNDMGQSFSLELPFPLLPSDENPLWNFGAEAGKIDESFNTSKGTHQFSDKDLKIWSRDLMAGNFLYIYLFLILLLHFLFVPFII